MSDLRKRVNPFAELEQGDRPWATYSTHPAYNREKLGVTPLSRISATFLFAIKFISLALKRLVHYEMIPFEVRSRSVLAIAVWTIKNRFSEKSKRENVDRANPVYQTLDEDGCSVIKMPDSDFEKLVESSGFEFKKLEQARARNTSGKREFDESRSTVNRIENPELYRLIENIFEKSGVMAAASAYMGRSALLVDVNPQINDKSDDFWLTIFPDLELPKVPDSAYFHRDASGGDLKAIIYMSDVGKENGPFNYALGSNKLKLSRFDNLVCEANDHNGLSATDRKSREVFAALPKSLQQKGSFGNDLVDDDNFSRHILDNCHQIVGDRGSIVLFDTKGIHRGGMVQAGERRVITCVLG
jgi:hypothetical protein